METSWASAVGRGGGVLGRGAMSNPEVAGAVAVAVGSGAKAAAGTGTGTGTGDGAAAGGEGAGKGTAGVGGQGEGRRGSGSGSAWGSTSLSTAAGGEGRGAGCRGEGEDADVCCCETACACTCACACCWRARAAAAACCADRAACSAFSSMLPDMFCRAADTCTVLARTASRRCVLLSKVASRRWKRTPKRSSTSLRRPAYILTCSSRAHSNCLMRPSVAASNGVWMGMEACPPPRTSPCTSISLTRASSFLCCVSIAGANMSYSFSSRLRRPRHVSSTSLQRCSVTCARSPHAPSSWRHWFVRVASTCPTLTSTMLSAARSLSCVDCNSLLVDTSSLCMPTSCFKRLRGRVHLPGPNCTGAYSHCSSCAC
mmetsp:Transcript_27535/g.44811  ORF Transcript_27535/g.44811 Transcript_27535/m.44811 type:complete len:371 (+) Transcript_27535:1434-2546(+)